MRIALLTPWASVAAQFFAIEIKFALKMIHAKIHGAVAGMLPWPLKKNESFSPNGVRKRQWLAILSTKIDLADEEIVRIYGKRWDIEVFFKMMKHYLNLERKPNCGILTASSDISPLP